MRKITMAAIAVAAFAFVGTAGAAVIPGVFDPGKTGCPVAKAQSGWLHLEKNCVSTTNAAAFGQLNEANGKTFASAAFTLKSASQCQGGSPRFNISTAATTYFLGCNNVAPVINADGTATYTFTAATIAAGGNQVPVPTGTMTAAAVLIDIQGVADLKNITLNGIVQRFPASKFVAGTSDHRSGEVHKHARHHDQHGVKVHHSDND
jgi:hypothetical protein